MNKRIQKKKLKQAVAAHERELEGTPWGRITLSFEQLQTAFAAFAQTLVQELSTYAQHLRGELQQSAKTVDSKMSERISQFPVVGPSVARGLHEFATDPNISPPTRH